MAEKEKVFCDESIKAENRARQRERESKPDIDRIAYEAAKDKNVRVKIEYGWGSKVAFTQTIQNNMQYLIVKNVLLDFEKAMLLDLASLCLYSSNVLAYPHPEITMRRPIKVTEIAAYIGQSRKKVSEVLGALFEKGIIYQVLNRDHFKQIAKTGNVRTERTLIINPEIIFSGNKNKISSELSVIAAQNDMLERDGHELPFKILLRPGDRYGKLVKRETWLKYQSVTRK